MWSLGMVLYYLCYSRLPYYQVDDVDLLKQEILHFKRLVTHEILFIFYSVPITILTMEKKFFSFYLVCRFRKITIFLQVLHVKFLNNLEI